MKLFRAIEPSLVSQSVCMKEVVRGNAMLIRSLPPPRLPRGDFYRKIHEIGFVRTMQSLLPGENRLTKMRLIRRALGRLIRMRRVLLSAIRMNGLRHFLVDDFCLIPIGPVCVEKRESATMLLSGVVRFGESLYNGSKVESRLLCGRGSVFSCGSATISQGCDIQMFDGGRLEIGDRFYSNVGLEVVSAEHVKIGNDVVVGRHVTIRDTNGHSIADCRYKMIDPVEIGDHVWLCDGCVVMPGVKIGSGSVIAAKSVVTHDVPANSLVAGVPAKVIRTNILWKE